MLLKRFPMIALLFALSLGSLPAHAGSTAGSVATSVTLGSDCSLNANPLSFGTSSALQPANVNASSTLQVTCSMSTPYTIAMGPSLVSGLPTGSSYDHTMKASTAMSNGRPIYLPYNITQDSAGSLTWGSTVGTNTVSGTGTGGLTNLTVYGHLTANSGAYSSARPVTIVPDTYTDTVTITLQY